MSTSATVNVRLSPTHFNLVIEALQDYKETHEELIDDPVVKEGDKRPARALVIQLDAILRALS